MSTVTDEIRSDSTNHSMRGLRFARVFHDGDGDPFDAVQWSTRTAEIKGDDGRIVFRQENVEVPKSWSQLATDVVASKYFWGRQGDPDRESSVRRLIARVVDQIAEWGRADGYFESDFDANAFRDDLAFLCVNQYGAFNSPVWFNIGVNPGLEGWCWHDGSAVRCSEVDDPRYQAAACFILGVEDTIPAIAARNATEMLIFKDGSGAGADNSRLRSSREPIRGGGRASGPVSFMKIYDATASVTKSGGRSRRAAKMETLKDWHPDILEFIEAKPAEEAKARALIAHGYPADFNGEAYGSVLFQNSNFSVRASDRFLVCAEAGDEWQTYSVITGTASGSDGTAMPAYNASTLLDEIARGTWLCGDPGLQYEDTIQRWHTCPNTAPINSSNPCSEYMFLDDSACNLASLNLMRFRRDDGTFDARGFRAACRIFITAQEILVDHGSYPTDRIALNSHKFRPLGLGYANLGSLIMASGRPYDSDEGRALAGVITAIMHGEAYRTSAEHAAHLGPFEGFALNREPMLRVMEMHRDALEGIGPDVPPALMEEARSVWDENLALGREHGYRNAQVTVLAPTGTIAFMMDCDTTGIEPDIALVKYKSLAGGGMLKIVNRTVPMALRTLGYDEPMIRGVLDYIDERDTIEGAPGLRDEHLAVFDCAFTPQGGTRSIAWRGHVRMMAAAQPFLSGAISKTVNMPREASVADIRDAYLEGWRLGLKALAIYRDGSKGSQPLSTGGANQESVAAPGTPFRERLPDTRSSVTHKFVVGGHEGYLTVGLFDDGRPGEVFVTISKEGSTVAGLMDTIGTLASMCLQYGVPVRVLADKFAHSRFEPSGFTKNPDIPIASSVVDYIVRWLGMRFVDGYRQANAPREESEDLVPAVVGIHFDGPPCDVCGALTVRCGTCHRCPNCGSTSGCG